MADPLHNLTAANWDKRRVIIALVVLVLILLLLFRRSAGPVTNINKSYQLAPLDVSPQYVNYNVPELEVPTWTGGGHGDYDWIKASDCACDCSPRPFFASPRLVETVYSYIAGPVLPRAPTVPFAVYVPPPLPTWWYSAGYNVHREPAMYIMTSTGMCGVLGKYSRGADYFGLAGKTYPQQSKNCTVIGDDAYIDGVHYKHNPAKDNTVLGPSLYASAGG